MTTLFKLKPRGSKHIDIDNKTTDEILDSMPTKTVIMGYYAGAGKTYLCNKWCEKNLRPEEKVVYVSPTNILKFKMQAEHPAYICKTVASLVGYENEGICTNAMNLERHNVKCVIFDEIFMSSIRTLSSVAKFMKQYPNVVFFATGDVNQNKPIEFPYNNIADYKKYMYDAVTEIFPNVITLKTIHRQKKMEQKELHKAFHKDIFDETIPVINTLTKYFNKNFVYTKANLTEQNICYFNFRRHEIVNALIKQKGKTKMYEVGDTIIVTKQFSTANKAKKSNAIIFNPNNYYKILAINEKTFKIQHAIDNEQIYEIPISNLQNFMLFYCSTCHSIQGDTMEGLTTIFDANSPYVSREWIYTALTRNRDFDNVKIFIHSNDSVLHLGNSKLKQYINEKLAGYKCQDDKKGRICEVITYDKTLEMLQANDKCYLCREKIYFELFNGGVESNFTLDRINNDEGHHSDNLRVCCLDCNRKMMDNEIF